MPVKTTHNLLTDSWAGDVQIIEEGIGRRGAGRAVTNDCQVALFEVVRDDHFHVNVTHKYATRSVPGWAGPAVLRTGFVQSHVR